MSADRPASEVRRVFYVLKPDETSQTSDRFEAAGIAAEWVRRGYDEKDVKTIAVEITDETVQQVAA